MKAILTLIISLLTITTLASSIVTSKSGPTVLHPADGSSVTFKDTATQSAHDACQAAVKALPPGKAQCWDSTEFTITASCEDVKAPHIELVKGTDGWMEPDARATQVGDAWITEQYLYVHNPAWPQGYPDCWARGWTNPDEWRANDVSDPDAPFMEKLEPGMTALEYPNDQTPAPESPEWLASWSLPESCLLRHHQGICYPSGSPGETCGPCT